MREIGSVLYRFLSGATTVVTKGLIIVRDVEISS